MVINEDLSYLNSIEYLFGKYLCKKNIRSRYNIPHFEIRRIPNTSRFIYSSAPYPPILHNPITIASILDNWFNYESIDKRFRCRSSDKDSLTMICSIFNDMYGCRLEITGNNNIIINSLQFNMILSSITMDSSKNFFPFVDYKVKESILLLVNNPKFNDIYNDKTLSKTIVNKKHFYIAGKKFLDLPLVNSLDIIDSTITSNMDLVGKNGKSKMDQLIIYYGNLYEREGVIKNGIVIDEKKYKILKERFNNEMNDIVVKDDKFKRENTILYKNTEEKNDNC